MKNEFMKRAIELCLESVNKGGGAFGCVMVIAEKIGSPGISAINKISDSL